MKEKTKSNKPTPKAELPSNGELIDFAEMCTPDTVARRQLDGVRGARRGGNGIFEPSSFKFVVRTHDIAGGVEQLTKNGHETTWMVFLFDTARPSKTTDDRSLALQYSVIDSRVGLDWVLLGPRNVADESTVATFAQERGYRVERLEINDVEFLRIEGRDVGGLGERILEELYGVPPSAELGLIIDGIELSSGKRMFL